MTPPMMERITITLPPALLKRVDEGRRETDDKRSTYIVKILSKALMPVDTETDMIRETLLQFFRSPEGKELLREGRAARARREAARGPGGPPALDVSREAVSPPAREKIDFDCPDYMILPSAPPAREKRTRGDSIPIDDEMRGLMRRFMEAEGRPGFREVRSKYGVDITNMSRWLTGEIDRIGRETWEKVKAALEENTPQE